jgi:hypothetical protein
MVRTVKVFAFVAVADAASGGVGVPCVRFDCHLLLLLLDRVMSRLRMRIVSDVIAQMRFQRVVVMVVMKTGSPVGNW